MSRQFTEKDAIINLQTYLRAQKTIDSTFPSVPIDGIFDAQTKFALTEFQRRNGISPTGTATLETWELLYKQYLEIEELNSLPGPIIPFPSYPKDYSLKPGDKSFLVSILQYMINEISIVHNTLPTLDINGEYDSATENTVSAFQAQSRLPASGITDRKTWNAIAKIFNLSTHYIEQN